MDVTSNLETEMTVSPPILVSSRRLQQATFAQKRRPGQRQGHGHDDHTTCEWGPTSHPEQTDGGLASPGHDLPAAQWRPAHGGRVMNDCAIDHSRCMKSGPVVRGNEENRSHLRHPDLYNNKNRTYFAF